MAKSNVVSIRSKPNTDGFISRINAAKFCDCSPQLIDKLIYQGRLQRFAMGRKVLLRRDELVRLIEEGKL